MDSELIWGIGKIAVIILIILYLGSDFARRRRREARYAKRN